MAKGKLGLVPLVAAAASFMLLLVGYPILKVQWTVRTVRAYCHSIQPGAPVAGLADRAQGASLQVMELPESISPDGMRRPGRISAWEGWIFVRSFCNINHEAGKVTSVKQASLD